MGYCGFVYNQSILLFWLKFTGYQLGDEKWGRKAAPFSIVYFSIRKKMQSLVLLSIIPKTVIKIFNFFRFFLARMQKVGVEKTFVRPGDKEEEFERF